MSKSGFSTLNRWLGRKNKDKSIVNGKLSKSSTNLSISSTNINETSQLEYNRITPLPAATTNAPFEQTFRITVLLPKDQLYVTRLGARVPLSKLLELVCDNKLLDEEKYEFRNPVDPSQVYSCDLTIGAVGLSEIRLCHKSESYDNFNSDEIIKLHRTSLNRESLSSSEFSSRNSKHTTKTTSPYSSTNSLNSVDSSAVSCGRPVKCQTKISAPPRKKRAAPRPPSQTVILEKSPLIIENGKHAEELKSNQESPLAVKDLSISTPNLSSSTLLHSDINGNDCNGNLEDFNDESSGNGSLNSHGYAEDTILYAQVQKKNALNSQNNTNVVEPCKDINSKIPEPSPRKRIVVVKKKTAAPPAPPPRNSLCQEDTVSIASTNVSSNSAPLTPTNLSQTSKHNFDNVKQVENEENNRLPTPLPRITTSTTLLNVTDVEQDIKHITGDSEDNKNKPNISKVLLNRTPTPEPRSLSCEPPEVGNCFDNQLNQLEKQATEEDCVSKQADSGIGEPTPSPLPDSLPSEISNLDVKINHFESSSDDDDMVKVYNFKLGKTLVKPVSETKTLEELTIMNSGQEETENDLSTPLILTQENTPNTLTETSSWNFSIPISPPPHFADCKFMDNLPKEPQSDTPITPKIMERPVLNFEVLKQENEEQQQLKKFIDTSVENSLVSPKTPMDNIVDELFSVIQEKGIDSLIKKSEEPQEIKAAKPNTLSNFSINTINKSNNMKPKEVLTETIVTDFAKDPSPLSSSNSTIEEEKLYRKRSSVSSIKQRRSITRSDSFHTTASPLESLNMNKRTSSQLSLDQMVGNLNRRKSSSELSIGESPSLQSLEIIKTILNSRKNSLANSSGEEDKEIEVNACRPSEELKFASLELKTCKNLEKAGQQLEIKQEDAKKIDIKEDQPPKELPKVYRYSGPPSINFSTWSERPKSQVAIKNEGDYIIGGAKSNQDIKNNRLSTCISINEPHPLAPKPGPTQRMGIPEKAYKVPVLVRPLKDVVVDKLATTTAKEDLTKQESFNGETKLIKNTSYHIQRPTVESVLKPQTQVIVNTFPRNTQRPTVEAVLRPQTQSIVNTSTLPRSTKQRYTTPCVSAGGPQILRSTSAKQQHETEKLANNQATIPGPQILRSSSINRQEMEKCASVTPAPFSQNTLRRTGFKEKMLAKEDQEKQNASNVQTSALQQKLLSNGDLRQTDQKFKNSITSAKLHLNLKKTNTILTSQASSRTDSPYSSLAWETPIFKAKSTTPQTAPVLSTTTPPAPPLPAMNIQLKTVTQARTPTQTYDSRDELLAAIRNFNKEGLKKA